ncbi:MAG: hypothetical protein IJR86_01795 [Bacteroidaceae bacterium]|nr:hypothetical protein [Bacteroidaceae bacterium]
MKPIGAQNEGTAEPQPIGVGSFGNIYDQFIGKAKEAIDFLQKKKSGEAIGALHHKDIGDIDLVWGEEGTGKSDGYGLAKLVKYHPDVLDNLQEILDDMHVTTRSENRVNLESDTHQAAVRLTWDNQKKTWLLTAFEKKNSVPGNTTDTDETSTGGKQNDTATLQNTVSEGKGTEKSDTMQENSEKSSYSITPKDYTTKSGKVLNMHLVKFGNELDKETQRKAKALAKKWAGWWSNEDGGFMMRDEMSAETFANTVLDAEALDDEQPLSLQDMALATEQEEPTQHKQPVSESNPEEPKRLVSDERMEELKERLRKKMLGQLNMGVDPEILAIGAELAVGHIERGLTKFADYAKAMIADLGDTIRPYLKSFYNAVRDMPEAEEYVEQMDSYDDVRKFDVLSIKPDADASDTVAGLFEKAEEIVKEQDAEEQAAEAKEKLAEQRNDGRKVQSEGVALDGTPLRPMTEKDLDNRDAKFYHQGKRVYIFAVMRSGEQVSATQFSEPHLDNIYLTNGQSIKPEELMVADETKEPVSTEEVEKILDDAKKDKKTSKRKKKDVTLQSPSFMGDLFNGNTEDNGHERTDDAVRTEGLPADGTDSGERSLRANGKEAGQESGRTDRRGAQGGVEPVQQRLHDGLRPSDQLNNTAPAQKRRTQQPLERPANPKNLRNNHAERGKNYAPKGVDARIEANIKAIELMKQLMESGEQATPEQMAVLRQFSGWGGLGKAFENFTAYTNGKPTPQYLRELLGEEAYQQANMSRNSAYYTPANVIDAMWDVAKAMGFQGGNVLEGSAGIGDIIGHMPTDMSERSNIHAVEIDQTTGNILSLLYPDAKVDVQGFEATQVENGSIDLAITNVPFVTGLRVNDTTGDKDLSKKFHDIHDFCIAKNVRKLREGGIGIFITSSGTLDNSAKLREWIIQEGGADVVGAFRMHNETFGGTGATSDIIVVRKRVNGMKSTHAIDVLSTTGERTADYDTGETKRVKGQEIPIIKHLSMDYNSYFVEHPEMMAGEMHFGFEKGETFRPTSKALYPSKDKNQDEMLKAWAESFAEKEWESYSVPNGALPDGAVDVYEDLGEGVKEGSIVVSNGQLCIAQRGMAVPLAVNANKVKGKTKVECFEAYHGIKEALSDLLQYQTENDDDAGLKPLLRALNKTYDDFVKTYGHLHKNTSISFLKNDVDFANILALEKFSERADVSGKRIQEFGKTDIFSQRVVDKEKAPEPKDVKDGIIASIYVHGRIDLPWIVDKLNAVNGQHTEESVKAEIIASGRGFENPATRQMEVSYEYLSGNVREKLAQAQANNSDGQYDANIKALEAVIPMNIPAHLIDFSIGSSWIDPKLYEEYVKEKTDIDVKFTTAGGTWFMKTPFYVAEQKNRAMGVVSEMLHKTIMGTQLIEAAMQNKTITVSETHKKWDGSTETITDKEATQACSNKIDEIRQDFKDWARAKMQSDPTMSEHIERIYNEMFNNYVPKEIPDEFVPTHFGGAATMVDGKEFALRPHQAKAAIRGTTQPLLLAHEVGSGKTYTLITTAMEMRRLGIARKPMAVVQNATVGQFVESAKELYPNAKVLTLDDKDHTGEGRRNFYAKIKYNDWDMIVVPQSVFERIPDSEERQMKFVQDKIEEKLLVLEQMKDSDPQGQSMIVRQAEKEIESLKDELAGLTDTISTKRKERDEKKRAVTMQNAEVKALEMLDRQTDDVENFDDMGIDAILVDEAHEYKHLGFATAMQRGVKGVDPSYSKKAQGVYLKTQAVLEKNNGRNVIFATGTPISNTAAEIWTFMRYLMPSDTMKEYGIFYFDDFVRNFGNLTQMLEFTTSGKFKENNRFAGYINLPELVRIWAGVADTVLNKDIEAQRIAEGKESKIPDMEDGKATDIYLPQTRALRSIMKFVKKKLDEYDKMSGKEKKENSHIPLTMYGIAKAAAVDARLVMSDATDEPQSKTNEAVRQILKSLSETDSYKGTVAVFADNYQNKKSGFNLYEDIREKLIAQGVPAEQIVVMKSGMSVKKKLEIFDKVNRGDVRVIMGSTFTLGTGVNIQERLHTLIHLDAPNRPMDYTQRNGRILRQGNLHKDMNKPVRVLRFGVEDSLDVTAYQRLKTKGAIADSIMNGKQMMANTMENRALEEEEDVFGDTVAQLSGSEYAMLKNQAEKDVRKYEAKKKQYEADQTYCHNEIPRLECEIKMWKEWLEKNRTNLATTESLPAEKTITVGKQTFASVDAMAEFIKEYNKSIKEVESNLRDNPSLHSETRRLTVNVGGIDFVFTTEQSIETKQDQGTLFSAVRRKMTYSCEAFGLKDVPVHQSLLREGLEDIMKNVVSGKDFQEFIERGERNLDRCEKSLAQIRERFGKPFEYSKELATAHERLDEYAELMKKELEEKEKKYAEMDADVDEATNITEAEEAEEEDNDDEDGKLYRMREEEPPVRKGTGNKVFVLKDGKLYPPMVANPNGEDTPVGVWLDADAAPIVATSKTGRKKVKAGGKGTQGGSGTLANRPGWHLGVIPYALQFNRGEKVDNPLGITNQKGEIIKVGKYFPGNFVWAEVEYANDVNYQEEAMSYGINESGNYQDSLAGLPHIPVNGSYRYRTNPNPATDPWIITGAMKVRRILKPSEVDELVKAAGREPQQREAGAVTDEQVEALNKEIKVQEIKRRFDELNEKYNGKPVQFIRLDNVGDEDFFRAIGATEEDIAEMSVEEMHEQAEKLKKLFKSRHSIGGYSRLNRKITIFADRIEPNQAEEVFFHENIHGILHDWYEEEPRGIAEHFFDAAPKDGGFKDWTFIEKGYEGKELKQKKEEFFVYWLSKAMVEGRTQEILDMLDWEDSERIENILKSIGYERGREEAERRKGEEDSEDSEETHGKFLPSLSGGRRNGQSTIGYDRRTEEAARKSKAEENTLADLGGVQEEQLRGGGRGEEPQGESRTLERDGAQQLSYDESLAASKAAGYTKRQHDTWWNRRQREKRNTAEDMAAKMHLGDRVTIVDSADELDGISFENLTDEDRQSKGWFDPKTGKIVIILGNHASPHDVLQTMLHEGVNHYGLRELFGKNFLQFLDNVYEHATPEIRRKIAELSAKYGFNIRTATEEYLGKLAEETDFENADKQGWWHEIKMLFFDMLHSIGLSSYGGAEISDNELRYILWRSYENLAEPGHYRNPFRVAEDVVMQDRLDVGNYEKSRYNIFSIGRLDMSRQAEEDMVAERGGKVLFRDGDIDGTKEAYNEAVSTGKKGTLRMTSFNFREAFQDSMLALKKLQEIVEKKFGVKLASFEDAYKYENTLSSLNMRQQEKFYKDYYTPMMKIADKIVAKEGASVKELNEYLICKHGLERNRVFAERDFEKYKKEHPDGEKTLDDFRKRDYSGLTEITSKEGIEEIEAEAERIVQEFEAKHGESCAKLWEAINTATKETLAHGFKCGMMSKATYEKVRDMFKYYVPLRGWDADTAEDVYDYVRGDYGGAFNATLKAAKGRTTTSDDVLATIGNMGYSSILQGNRNNMKIRLFNMASRYPTDVCSVRDMWLVENAWGEWVSNFPAIPEDATPEQVADILETHEVEMSALEEQGKAKRQRNALDIGFHIDKKNIPEHAVVAYIGGKPNIVYINGNPRAAQAVNGKTGNALPGNNPLARLVDFIFKDTKRYYSSMLTTYKPTFAVSNFVRDLGHSIAMTYVDKGLIDMAKYIANLPVSMAYVIKGQSGFKAGDSKMSTYFREFLDNGGMTGYAHLEDVEQWKAKNKRRWASLNALQKAGYAPVKAIGGLMAAISWLSETLELIPRFNTYVAERRDGKDILTSVKAAKDITVNFNKKGSEVTPGVWGAVANTLRYEKMFFNPIVQSLEQFYRLGKKHPVRMAVATLHLPILGAIMPYVNMMLVEAFAGGDGDDDKDKYDYWLQNEYTRRNNILIFTGNGYIKMPIAQGFREFYGMGEAIATRHFGKCDDFELAYSLVEQIRTMFSLEGQTNYKQWSLLRFIMPEQYGTLADIANNENFMGGTLWYENMYKEHLPEYKKAKPSTWSPLVSISKQMNEWLGYDDDVAGDMSGRWMNPAAWQHVIQNYGGGVAEMVGDIASMVIDKGDDKETDSSQWPIAKRFYTKATEERENWVHYGMYKDFEDDYEFAKEKVSALNKKDITDEEWDRQFADFAKRHPKAAAIYSAWDDGELVKDIKKAEFGSEKFWELINEAVDAAEKAVYKPWNQQERQQ